MLENTTKGLLKRYKLIPKKKYGQNFLIDESVLDDIVRIANIDHESLVMEIGPGLGSLTEKLLNKANKVIAVEIDNQLISLLNDRFGMNEGFSLINDDILKLDLDSLDLDNVKVVANLPYYITTPIMMKFLESQLNYSSLTLMMQKEVADRICASHLDKEYGAISLAIAYRCEASIELLIPPSSFIPAPKVDSCLVHLKKRATPPVKVSDEAFFFKVIRTSFLQRRKTLINSLSNNKISNKEELSDILNSLNIPVNIRAEKLSLDDFARLSDSILKKTSG